jgi:phthiocerol/phenolphthiocerol synthesis type-I polyketide synthase E
MPIAIIGMAARLPMAADTEEYWANLASGRDCISRLTEEELLAAGVPAAEIANPSYVRAAPLIPDAGGFEPEFFGMTARDALVTDPQQRLFLETSYLAAENAGYDPRDLPESTGVFAGAAHGDYAEHYVKADRKLLESSGQIEIIIGNHNDYIASSVAYRLGLSGPAVTLGTACSSSLVAVHLACVSLSTGESDLALAGGVCVEMPYGHGYRWVSGSTVSRDGAIRPFDANATGTVFGSGVGVVALRRLDDALAAGDPIRAVILGSAINNDGAGKVTFSAPSVDGQSAVIARAMRQAGLTPGQIGYVEAHGTGTIVGDPLELAALELAYRQLADGELAAGTIPLGSSKGNIGHAGQAAGVAGLIKTVLCLEHEQIAPTLNFTQLNPSVAADATPFRIVATAEPWPRGKAPRFTAVSSFGIGGTNAHIVVGEAPAAATPAAAIPGPHPVLWSARNTPALAEYATRLSAQLATVGEADLAAVTATLLRSRIQHRLRAGAVAGDAAEAARLLAAGEFLTASGEDVQSRATVFLLPGQGSQYPGMGTGLYGADEAFAAAADEAHAAFSDAGADLRDLWLSGAGQGNDTRIVQPLIFVTDYAVARCLIARGVQPTALVGHSLGEFVAACLAGVMSVRDAARAVVARANAMADLPSGRLIAVAATPAQVEPLLGGTIALAAVNGPGQVVVGARLEDLEEATRAVKAAGLQFRVLDTSHAFHTPMMKPAADAIVAALSDVALAPPRTRLGSPTTGRWVTDREAIDPAFWAANIARPVRFGEAIAEVLSEPAVLIEAGPGAALTSAAALSSEVRLGDSVAIATLRRPKPGAELDETRSLLTAVSRAWVEGADVRWSRERQAVRRVPLPPYPFQRSPYWASPRRDPAAARGEKRAAVLETNTTPFTRLGWRESDPGPIRPLTADETALALMPADPRASRRISRWLRQCGYRVIAVTEGEHFTADDGAFTVQLSQAGDQLGRVMSALAEQRWPSVVVHGLGMETGWAAPDPAVADDQLNRGIRSLVAMTQSCLRVPPSRRRPRLVALTTHAVDVSGGERLDPLKAALTGVIRSARLEEPGLAARLIDVSEHTADDAVTRELLQASIAPVVALRSDQRWLHDERPVVLDGPAGQPVRRCGVYLVTGGLGAVGATVARALIETGQEPTVVLVGRSPAPAADGSGGPAARRFRALKETGGDIHYLSADVTNPRDVRRCVDLVAAQFGPVNGVFHAAGRLPGGPLSTLRQESLDEVLAPKVMGTLLLERQLADSPALDLFVHFSSRAAINGLADGADYAAANAFVDAHARTSRLARERVLSVDWPAWAGAGMAIEGQRISAADSDEPGRELCLRTIELSPGSSWVVDEHRLEGTPLFPGTGYVDLILTALADEVRQIAKITVEDLVFSTPLAITASRSVWLAARTGRGALQVRVMSRPADGDGPWVTHATARLRDGDAAEPAPARLPGLIRGLRPANPDAVFADAGLLTFGPRWDCLVALHGSADAGEWVCELRLPGQFAGDLRRHFAHPALLDMAAAVLTVGAQGGYLPYAYERVRAFRPVPAHVFAHVRRERTTRESVRAAIDVVDAEGTPVLEISGLILKRVEDPAALKAGLAAGTGGITPAPAINGLPPATAGRLLLQLLGHGPRHVMAIMPFVNGAADSTGIGMAPRSAPARDGAQEQVSSRGPAPDSPGTGTAAAVAPGSVTEVAESLLGILSEVLGLQTGSIDDDFFELGGNSLTAVTFMSAVENRLGLALGIGALFDHPTPRLMAEAIRDGRHG